MKKAATAILLILGVLACVGALALAAGKTAPPLPPPMIRIPAVINEVHDGDTLTVSFDFSARIRLVDCWAPELKSGEPGAKSKANLIKLTSKTQRCMVEVPLFDDIGKSTTLGRVLGRVTVDGQDKDLSTQQVEGGFATRTKE